MDRINGTHAPFFFIWNPNDTELLFKRSFMCRSEVLEPFALPHFRTYSKHYKLTEVL